VTLFDTFPSWIKGLGAALRLGQPLMAAALVNGPQGREPPSEGWVTFLADGKTLGTRPLVAGPHALIALYGGTGARPSPGPALDAMNVSGTAPGSGPRIWWTGPGSST